jgi:hypothetical protein
MFPDWRAALPGALAREVRRATADRTEEADVQDWLTVLTTVLSHRARLAPGTVELVAACGDDAMPGLRRLLDEPLTGP